MTGQLQANRKPQVLAQGDLFGLPHKLPSVRNQFNGANRAQTSFDSLKASRNDKFLESCGCTYIGVNQTDIEVRIKGA